MKNVIITGGTRGIGAACTRLFCEKGFRVIAIYNNDDESAKLLSEETGCIIKKTDISDFKKSELLISDIIRDYKHIDILINNAGIAQQKLFIDINNEEWNRMINVNLNSIYNLTHAVVPEMIKQLNGVIVNVSSIWGQYGASCEVHYSAAKAGAIGFTKALAKELGLSGIRVNCIAPGFIDTKMNENISQEDKDEACREIPLGRLGKAEECAQLIYFLSSDDASYITGQIIGINGGWEM